eukprot:1625090-Amphidinium_carterae.1
MHGKVRSGLKFSMRVSELLALVDALEESGFVTKTSSLQRMRFSCLSCLKWLKELTDEHASKLDMPLKLAADLRIAAAKASPH